MTALLGRVGNASSLHASGREARRVVEESRERIAKALSCRPGEVVFTSGGTESDNLAIKGLFWARRAEDPRRVRILSTPIEHHAVLDPLEWLGTRGRQGRAASPVDRQGRLDVEAFRAAVESDPESVALVTVMWANNEVGTVQPVAEVVEIAHAHGIPVHTDAVQALGQLPLDFAGSGVDAMTVTGHKIGGPYGVGALVVRRELQPTALLHGGGQERDIRSGTIDPPAIAGFAVACELAVERQPELAARLAPLRDRLVDGVRREVPDAIYNGDPQDGPDHRLPGNAHLEFPGCEGDSLLMLLDARGIECSTGSACDAGVPAGLARAARDGLLGGVRAVLAAVLARPHLDRGRRRRARRGDRAGGRTRPQRGPVHQGQRERADASPGSDVGRRRLGRGGRPRRRAGSRRHRHPPRALAQPEVLPHRRPRLLHDRGRQRRPPGGRRDRDPVLRVGPERAVPRGRGRGLPQRVRRGPHAEPVPALQREDQVRRRARPGDRARASTRSSPATTRSCAATTTG